MFTGWAGGFFFATSAGAGKTKSRKRNARRNRNGRSRHVMRASMLQVSTQINNRAQVSAKSPESLKEIISPPKSHWKDAKPEEYGRDSHPVDALRAAVPNANPIRYFVQPEPSNQAKSCNGFDNGRVPNVPIKHTQGGDTYNCQYDSYCNCLLSPRASHEHVRD